jgi:HAD superfamily hydrolase (TIGR01549 family)
MIEQLKKIKGFAFDLDGTIVDSKLNFIKMRNDLQFPMDVGILEHLEEIRCEDQKKSAWEVVNDHERLGAEEALLIDGVLDLLIHLKKNNIPIGILTRNSNEVAHISLNKFNLEFDIVLSRDDCLAKPNPEGLEIMAKKWGINTSEIVFIGDHTYDVETAINASSLPVMFDPEDKHPESDDYLKIKCFKELLRAL